MKKLSNFKVGQKVWIERTDFVENVDMIRKPQTIESITEVPVTLANGEWIRIQSIDIVGSVYIYNGEDLRAYKEGE